MSDPHLVTGGGQVRLPLMEPRFWSRQRDTEKQALQQGQGPNSRVEEEGSGVR